MITNDNPQCKAIPASRDDKGDPENRRFLRVPLPERAHYRHAECGEGWALVQDVGRGGMRVRLGRYFRPGTLVHARLDSDEYEFAVQVAWCAPVHGSLEFDAGFAILHTGAETLAKASRLVYTGLAYSQQLSTSRPWDARTGNSDHMAAPWCANATGRGMLTIRR